VRWLELAQDGPPRARLSTVFRSAKSTRDPHHLPMLSQEKEHFHKFSHTDTTVCSLQLASFRSPLFYEGKVALVHGIKTHGVWMYNSPHP
jgi:hypothetical protein